MITERKKISEIGVVATLILFFIFMINLLNLEKNTCLGLQLITVDEYSQISKRTFADFDIEIAFNDVPAAVDRETNTIYISQNTVSIQSAENLEGVLSVKNINLTAKLVKDENFGNLGDTVRNGRPLTMIVISPENEYCRYSIVISTLPVMNITGEFFGYDEESRELFYGDMAFWDGYDEEYNGYKTESSKVEWHKRGQTTAGMSKKPWKLSLKNENGQNKNLSFCGLGEDDDWILNAMALDDLNIREKLVMDLCREMSIYTGETFSSQAEYMELVINGQYQGLYIIMRRIDDKYLNLDDDILLKGIKTYVSDIDVDTYNRIYTPYDKATTDIVLENYFVNNYVEHIDLDSYIEMTLIMQYCSLYDNSGSKNIYFLLENLPSDYKVKLLLWDVDMSFGLHYSNTEQRFVYRFDYAVKILSYRNEQKRLRELYPNIDYETAQRWFELKQTVFNSEKTKKMIDDYYIELTQSGAYQRDIDQWGLYYNGEDTIENVYRFIDLKIEQLDNYYRKFLNQ